MTTLSVHPSPGVSLRSVGRVTLLTCDPTLVPSSAVVDVVPLRTGEEKDPSWNLSWTLRPSGTRPSRERVKRLREKGKDKENRFI